MTAVVHPLQTAHPPILIEGNANFTAANGVVAGSGTPSDPYLIAGWLIDASTANAVEIRDTTAPFVIRDIVVGHSNPGAPFNSTTAEQQPSLSSDGRTLVFASSRSGGFGGTDIWTSTRTPSGK